MAKPQGAASNCSPVNLKSVSPVPLSLRVAPNTSYVYPAITLPLPSVKRANELRSSRVVRQAVRDDEFIPALLYDERSA